MIVLITGGTGYIGSHVAVQLLNAGHDVVIADNLCNSSIQSIERVVEICRDAPGRVLETINIDIADEKALDTLMGRFAIDAVVHCAGLKAVGESVEKPLLYYRNNLDTTLTLMECMKKNGIHRIVFSSSATVYGTSGEVPYKETTPRGTCTNAYGWTKYMIEQILMDEAAADPELSVVLLRYFNPVGAHESGMIGESPVGIPNNLMPYITQVAIGKRDHLTVFGKDYDTPDGTCRRDYIHVMDLASGHVNALEYAMDHKGVEIFNLGTGVPYSVLDMVRAFGKATGIDIKYEIGARRSGDLAECWANTDKALKLLGWKAERSLEDMCQDAWNWQKKNPNGYE